MSPKVILATLVIFCTGFFAGVMFPRHGLHTPKPGMTSNTGLAGGLPLPNERRILALRQFTEDMDLTTDQRERIESHIQNSQERTRVLWDLVSPEVQEEFKRLRSDVVSELSPEQRKRFEERSRRYRRERARENATNAPGAPSQPPLSLDRPLSPPPLEPVSLQPQ